MVYVVQQKHDVKISTRATRTFMPVRFRYLFEPDSLPTVFTFVEALSSVMEMIQGHNDSRCGGPGSVCCAVLTS